MAKSSPVQRLRTLNSLLTAMNSCGAETAQEIQKAVDFFIDEIQINNPGFQEFPDFAREILNIHTRNNSKFGLCFWCVDVSEHEPLWLRTAFVNKLESLNDFRNATMVIYGLQDTVVDDKQYWTQKMDIRYLEIRNYLESIAAECQKKGCRLNLIYV